MPFEGTLPAELWLIILDMVIAAGITLLEQCDHTSFPDIHAYLRYTASRAAFDNSYGQLRLVCRMFNGLLGASPHYIMKSSSYSIPTSARAVYIIEGLTPSEHVRQLLEEPLICHRLVHLDTFLNHPGLPNMQTTFDLLCENSRSLPNLRCLTLRLVVSDGSDVSFWARLNNAFPLLRRLVMDLESAHQCRMPQGCDGDVTFGSLELLMSRIRIPYAPRLHFPSLRHVSLDIFAGFELAMLARSSLLESAIFDILNYGAKMDLKAFPRLRSLRVRAWDAQAILPVRNDHPLEHLWLIVGSTSLSPQGVQFIMGVARNLPGVSRITLDISVQLKTRLERELQRADLRSIGMSVSRYGSRVVLKRTQIDFRMSEQPQFKYSIP